MKIINNIIFFWAIIALLSMFSSCTQPTRQETKVVYGPIEQTYKLPDVSGTIYYVSPDGDANADGIKLEKPTSIEAAIAKVVTGDAIIMRGGIYRTGNLIFNQGITIQPYSDEKPILNGTLVAELWEQVSDSIWVSKWEYLFPAGPEYWWHREHNEKYTPMHRFNNDAVFIDGIFLHSAGSTDEVNDSTFYVDYDNNKIYIGVDPDNKLVEITAFRKAIYRTLDDVNGKVADKKGPIIRGITFTQYPDTMVHIGGVGLAVEQHGNDVVGTLFENCTFSNCFRIGMFAISDSLIMRHCNVVNTNTEGVYVVASNDILLEKNIFENNNIENWTGFFPSSVKIFNQSHRAIVRENLVVNHPNSNGVWWDVGNNDGVFVNNHVEKVMHSGFFFEISSGAIVAGNVFENCDQSIFVLNSSNVHIFNNTIIDSRVSFRRDSRGDQLGVFGWHVTLGPGVEERFGHVFVNNLIYMTKDNDSPMIHTGQPSSLCERLSIPHLKAFNNNIFIRDYPSDSVKVALIEWTPYNDEDCKIDIFTPEELHKINSEFSADCEYLENIEIPLFVDIQNKDFHLSSKYLGIGKASPIPSNIAGFIGVDVNAEPFIGAVMPE
jgi:parallel beta-helix repeat protein